MICLMRSLKFAMAGGLLMTGVSACAQDQDASALFPFVIPWDDAAPSLADVSSWNETPAGAKGFVSVRDGHFADGAGQRIRFLGTNLCFSSAFPPHEVAGKVARRMAKFGINIVRFHHMDNAAFPHGIWDGSFADQQHMSEEALDRLDYLIYQLKLNGIYADLNLHVSRTLGEADGIEAADQMPTYDKGVDNFHPRMIELQRQYAGDLLTHVNRYTGSAYVDEPAVAMIEINNENSLLSQWVWGAIDSLPDYCQRVLDERWHEWLQAKYGDTEALRAAWSAGAAPLGEEMLTNAGFAAGAEGWTVELHEDCEATASRTDDGPEGQPALRIDITQVAGPSWYVQFHQSPLPFEANAPYQFSLWAKADPERDVGVNNFTAHEPWHPVGFSTSVHLGTEWQQYTFSFRASETDDNCRIGLTGLASAPGTIWIAAASLRPGGVVGLPEDASLEDGTVPRPTRDQMGRFTPQAATDYVDFLLSIEEEYWTSMARYLHDQLGVQCPVTGTQMGYTPIDTHIAMDYFDAHAYWHHPSFPGRPWDSRNWWVGNTSMVSVRGGTLPGLACCRVAGAPYTISEYNHPAPNQYSSECYLLLAAYGALQDWDGIFSFAYNHSDRWDDEMIASFFDLKSHPTKLVTLPVAAALFRRGDVAAAREVITALTTRPSVLEKGLSNPADGSAVDEYGVPATAALVHRTEVAAEAEAVQVQGPAFAEPPDGRFASDTGELTWDAGDAASAVVTVNTPRSKAVIGFADERRFQLGDVSFVVGRTRLSWAAITATVMEGDSFGGPARILITGTGDAQNTGWAWEANGDRVTVRDQWGQPPSLVEGIPAVIELPAEADRVRAYALDPTGQPKGQLEVRGADRHAAVQIGPQHQTLWYEIIID